MNIFSNHAHVYPDKLAPTWKPILGTIDNLIKFMDEVGIDRTVVFAHDGGEEDFDTVKWIYEKFNGPGIRIDSTAIGFSEKEDDKQVA